MSEQLTRKERRARRRARWSAHSDDADPAVGETPGRDTGGDVVEQGPARFDPETIARAAHAAAYTDGDGRSTIMPDREQTRRYGDARDMSRYGTGFVRPDQHAGTWRQVPDTEIRRELSMAGILAGHRMLAPRVDAAAAALDRVTRRIPEDQLPSVDPVACCTPTRPGLPPKNWPTSPYVTDDMGRTVDIHAWVGTHCYGDGGRWIIAYQGNVYAWRPDQADAPSSPHPGWEQVRGDDDWFNAHLNDWAGPAAAGMAGEARAAIAYHGDRWPTDPSEVAAYDLARAIAKVEADQARHYGRNHQ
ncbi:MAG: hypothetical protein QM809_01130 [Gordonia sp. (in: high G+C Gram-positive bacteria)]|uniref:hypothetical protein n=1 Tax=Gordonia sp. (in: high G+C Gram-positive bacteria) TaxID=84139 RepID=UPI0039E4E0CA